MKNAWDVNSNYRYARRFDKRIDDEPKQHFVDRIVVAAVIVGAVLCAVGEMMEWLAK